MTTGGIIASEPLKVRGSITQICYLQAPTPVPDLRSKFTKPEPRTAKETPWIDDLISELRNGAVNLVKLSSLCVTRRDD
ncbi:unnamed protein product [Gadus morhua 'NCC']